MLIAQEIADIITSLAKKKGETVEQAMINNGAGRSLVANLRKGRMPSAAKLYLVADYFGVSVEWLLTGKERQSDKDENGLMERYTFVFVLKNGEKLEFENVTKIEHFVEDNALYGDTPQKKKFEGEDVRRSSYAMKGTYHLLSEDGSGGSVDCGDGNVISIKYKLLAS